MPNPDIWLASSHDYTNTTQEESVSAPLDKITVCMDLLETILRTVKDIQALDITNPREKQARERLVDDLCFAIRSINELLEAFAATPARGDNAS